MDYKRTFLYNLWNYIPDSWSLKMKCGLWKVLEKSLITKKMVAVFCLGINTLIKKNEDTSNWCRIISHWVHYCYLTQFLTFFVAFFPGNVSYNCHFCQSVEEIPALNSNDGKKTFFGILVLASLAYKYCRIIRVHLRNIP